MTSEVIAMKKKRGRPPKIKAEDNMVTSIPTASAKPTKEDTRPKCEMCGKPLDVTPIRIDLTRLTGLASWHRELKNDKVIMCSKCAKEFSSIIDKYLQRGVYTQKKFEL